MPGRWRGGHWAFPFPGLRVVLLTKCEASHRHREEGAGGLGGIAMPAQLLPAAPTGPLAGLGLALTPLR